MQDSVENNSMKLGFEGCSQSQRIVPHPNDTNIYFSLDWPIFRQLKGDNIGIVVVFEKLPVYIKKAFIRAKNEIEAFKPSTFLLKNAFNKGLQ